MKKGFFILIWILCLPLATCFANDHSDGVFASIETNKGIITLQLFYKKAPLTVINFIGLADGSREWLKGVNKEKQTDKPLYSNLKFHRVIKNFMVQTGDPQGTGRGGPGYTFPDEFHPDLVHNQKGILSMANRGPGTNGSQFFITLKATPWLDQHHSVFGKVLEGADVLDSIEQGDQLRNIKILRKGDEAKNFNAEKAEKIAIQNQEYIFNYYVPPLPEQLGNIDEKRVPVKNQSTKEPGDFEFIVLGYQGVHVSGKLFYLDHKTALKRAIDLTRHARSEGVSFSDLVKRYSDLKVGNHYKNKKITHDLPAVMKYIFRLRSGQVSDPIDTPRGIYIFHRI
ncbi:MAG: peptidylprolyl isomerase [Proteobacteria bacterium]|nr:peptidylprolyl isomerase [Pseudomonadota bacterium]